MRFFIKITTVVGLVFSLLVITACSTGSTGISSNSGNLLSPADFSKAFNAAKDKAGSDELLEITLSKEAAQFKFRKGSSTAEAYGFQWLASEGKLKPVKVKLIGSGTLEGQGFPSSQVSPDAIDKLISGAKRKAGSASGFEVTSMRLTRPLVRIAGSNNEPTWMVGFETDTRSGLSYEASIDGSKAIDRASEAIKQAQQPSDQINKATKQAQQLSNQATKVSECITKAAGDPQKIQKCAADASSTATP